MANRIDQDIFKPIPMTKGWIYRGEVLAEEFVVSAKSKYTKELLKHTKNRGNC